MVPLWLVFSIYTILYYISRKRYEFEYWKRTSPVYRVLLVLFIMLWMGLVARGERTPGTVGGKVYDRQTGKPVAGANIMLHAGLMPFKASTDSSGRFNFVDVPTGRGFQLDIHHPDYRDEIMTIDVEPGSVSRVSAALITPFLRLESPNGGEELFAGSVYRIVWHAAGLDRVTIRYSADGGRSWVPVGKDVDARSGVFEWDIPDIPGTSCLIRIDAENGSVSDASDGYFRVGST